MARQLKPVMTKRDNQILARFRDGLAVHHSVPENALRAAVRKLLDKKEELEAQLDEIESKLHVPGHVRCSKCKYPYLLRRAILLGAGGAIEWVFQPDCKCKGTKPEPVEGP